MVDGRGTDLKSSQFESYREFEIRVESSLEIIKFMKNPLIIFMLLFWVTSAMLSQSSTIVDNNSVATNIDSLMQYSYENGMFNGVILVSQDGQVIYKNALGYADKENDRKLNKASVFGLASVSKQFTTMAIMILKEQKMLSYNDKLSKYFPAFPDYANTVTCLLYTSPSPRDATLSRMPSSA